MQTMPRRELMSRVTSCALCATPLWRPESLAYQLCAECRIAPTLTAAPPLDTHHVAFIVAVVNELGGRLVSDERDPESERLDSTA